MARHTVTIFQYFHKRVKLLISNTKYKNKMNEKIVKCLLLISANNV